MTSTLRVLTPLITWAALLVAPGSWEAVFSGSPLGWYERATLTAGVAVAAWLALFRPRREVAWTGSVWLAAFVALKVLLGAMDGASGWIGSYTLVDTTPARVAPFFERLRQRPYRIDPVVDFEGRSFRFHFLNDVVRYNNITRFGMGAAERDRTTTLPIDMAWSTWIQASRSQTLTLRGSASGEVLVYVDHAPIPVQRNGASFEATTSVTPRDHQIAVEYRKPELTPAAIKVGVLLDGSPTQLRAFADREPLGFRIRLANDALVLLGSGVLLWLLIAAYRGGLQARLEGGTRSALLAWVASLFILHSGFSAAQADVNATFNLGAGDDPLAYESNARNILEQGLMMPLGKPIGQGQPYFFYPLYSYTLAAAHYFIGEDYDAVRLFNGIASAVIPLLLWGAGWRLLPLGVQGLGMIALVAFVICHSGRYWQTALTDNLFIPIALGAIWVAAESFRARRAWVALAAGGVAALAGSTRPSFLLFVGAYVVAMLLFARPLSWRVRFGRAASFVAGYGLVLLPFVLRNYVMSGKAVMVVTLSHAITVALIPPEGGITPPAFPSFPPTWLEALHGAWQMFRAEPALLTWLELRKVLFTLGFTNLGPAGFRLHPEFPILFVGTVIALALKAVPRWLLPAFAAFLVSHMVAMVLAYPWTYGYKTILPVQYLFLFCSLYAVGWRWTRHTTRHATSAS